MNIEIENPLKTLARRWRGALRQCLIVSFQSHKGGQGRTLSCAHLAVEALLSAERDESKPVKLLMMDCDWSAPGLSYLIGALPERFKKEKTAKFSTNKVLGDLIDALGKWSVEDVKRLALCQGAPLAEDIPYWCGLVENTIGATASDLVGEIRLTTELSGGGTSDSGSRIYFLDADLLKSVADVSQQFLFQSRLSEAPEFQKRLHSADQLSNIGDLLRKDPFFAWLTRLLVLYLVRGIGLDYVFLDCQAGTSIHSWFLSTLIADVVLLPTSGLEQSQHGTRALAQWLQHARDQIDLGRNVSYGPLAVEIFASNIPVANLAGIGDGPIEKYIDLAPKIKREYQNRLGFPLATFLPYVEPLASRERMAYDLKPDELSGPQASVRDLYIAGIRTLLMKCEELARQKRGAEHLLFTEASEKARRGAEILRGKPPIRIAVEAGEFGEKPFKELLRTAVAEGVTINVEGIDHMVIYRSALADTSEWLANHDIVAFPHYLLGYLAAEGKILPLHSLDLNPTSLLFETKWLDDFLLSNETCFANGALYAFPFSVMRKLLLYRCHSDASTIPRDWNEFIAMLQNKSGSLALENDFKSHVGVWYDWLEVVYAFGGADFRRNRGSDYGTCWLNNPATVDGTLAYLTLFWRGLALSSTMTWNHTIQRLLVDHNIQASFVWSDILNHRWLLLKDQFSHMGIPPATIGPRHVVAEGWVMGVPSVVEPARLELIGEFMSWFLHPGVQQAFAAVGGNPSYRHLKWDDIERPVLKAVHDILTPNPNGEAGSEPKISFAEAPVVIDEVRRTLEMMIQWGSEHRTREAVARAMDKLARDICRTVLKMKARYIPLENFS